MNIVSLRLRPFPTTHTTPISGVSIARKIQSDKPKLVFDYMILFRFELPSQSRSAKLNPSMNSSMAMKSRTSGRGEPGSGTNAAARPRAGGSSVTVQNGVEVEVASPPPLGMAWVLAAALGLLAFAVYLGSLSQGVFPGRPAQLMAGALGVEPWLSGDHPLWRLGLALWRALPGGGTVRGFNLFSALCGAVAITLFVPIVVRWVHGMFRGDAATPEQARCGALLAGLGAAVCLAFSPAVWSAATRLDHLTFDLLLLLLALSLLQLYEAYGKVRYGLLLAVLCGIGAVESIFVVLLAPLIGVRLLVAIYARRRLTWGRVAGLALLALLGAVLACALAAWHFSGQEGAALAGYTGWRSVAATMVRQQLLQVARFFPRVGWIWMVVLIVLPWLIATLSGRRGIERGGGGTFMLFHLALLVTVCLVVWCAPLAPTTESLRFGRLPVLETLLVSLTAGYLVAYWFSRYLAARASLVGDRDADETTSTSRPAKNEVDEQHLGRLRVIATAAVCVLTLAALALPALRNRHVAGGKRGAFADACARWVLEELGPRNWLATDGRLDPHLAILASQQGRPLTLVNMTREHNPVGIRRLCRQIELAPELASRRMQSINAAHIGVTSFIRGWLADGTGTCERLGIQIAPELWSEAGKVAVPAVLVYLGQEPPAATSLTNLLARHREAWERLAPDLRRSSWIADDAEILRATMRRHVGVSANNLGVLLEDVGHPREAFEAYLHALTVDPYNRSALVNRLMLTRAGLRPEYRVESERSVRAMMTQIKREPPARQAARFHGYIRSAEAFAKLGLEWSAFGQGNMARSALQQALRLGPPRRHSEFAAELAALYATEGSSAASEELFRGILAQDGTNRRALLGLLRLAIGRQDVETAEEYLQGAIQAGVPAPELALDQVAIDLAANRREEARRRLVALTDADSGNLPALALLASLWVADGEAQRASRELLPRMRKAAGNEPHHLVYLTEGRICDASGPASYRAARTAYQRALGLRPGRHELLAEILRLDYLLRDLPAMEHDARKLLALDRRHPFANYAMGFVLAARGELERAEDHFTCSAAAKSTPMVWNDLAEVQRRLGKPGPAEQSVRKALELQPGKATIWDTLACVLLDTNRVDEALQAIDRALELDPNAGPNILLTRAEALSRAGLRAESLAVLSQVRSKLDRLSAFDRNRAERLGQSMARSGAGKP